MHLLNMPSSLISVSWLAENINHPNLVLLDASWFMPALMRDGKAEWAAETIANAQYFDFDNCICDKQNPLPHMMANEQEFQLAVRALGINQDSAIVVFDRLGIFSSPRVWWMFKSMGFNNIAVLDGGLPAWKAANYALAAGKSNSVEHLGNFIALEQPNLFVDKQFVAAAITDSTIQIVDARSENRFFAREAEAKKNLRSGHMPSAQNLPFTALLESGRMKPVAALAPFYETCLHGASDQQETTLLFSCGSGVTACILALGAHLCGYQKVAVYDGSWSEWGADTHLPVVS